MNINGIQNYVSEFECGHDCLWLQMYRHEFYRQGMWCRAIHWRVQDIKFRANILGSHSIRKSWDRRDLNPNPRRSDLDRGNYGSLPGEPQPIACIWEYSPRQPFFISNSFHNNRGPSLYDPVVCQRCYTWSYHKNPHIQRPTDVPTYYLFVGAWWDP